jgi:hypothetical protein
VKPREYSIAPPFANSKDVAQADKAVIEVILVDAPAKLSAGILVMRVITLKTPFLRVILFLLIALAGASGPARADNPYAGAGISNPAQVTQFVVRLKQAVATDDRAAIAGMVNYPLRVNSAAARPATYRNAAALSANYTRVFTPEVKAAVAAAKPDDLFARDQGVMIGNGEIWMNEIGGSMKIITVNHTR